MCKEDWPWKQRRHRYQKWIYLTVSFNSSTFVSVETDLPQYMAAKLPMEAACSTVPTIAITAHPMRVILRPNLSANQLATKAPRKHPACRVETIFASRLALPILSSPWSPNTLRNSLVLQVSCFLSQNEGTYFLKLSNFRTPPIIPMSIPNSIPAKHAEQVRT